MAYWGFHLMLDCSNCNRQAIGSRDNIAEFIATLVTKIDMVSFGEPMIERFATHCEDKSGYSFIQMIETSNISGHLVDSNGDAYIDVFSCKPYDNDTVIEVVKEYFAPEKIRINYLTRNAG